MNGQGFSLTLVMPCRNEAENIEKSVRDYYGAVAEKAGDCEFLVIDGNSTDGTFDILKKLAAELPKLKLLRQPTDRPGHGAALVIAYGAASKDWVFQVDADGQFEPEDFWKLYGLKDGFDFILGVRSCREDPITRRLLSRFIAFVNKTLFGVSLKDANCPFRLMRREALAQVMGKIPRNAVAPNIFMALQAARGGKFAEVDVVHKQRGAGKNTIGGFGLFKTALKGFFQIMRFSGDAKNR